MAVTDGQDWAKIYTGLYTISKEKASRSPEKPVFKLDGQDKYIYFNPDNVGWRIGILEHLSGANEGGYWFSSNSFSIFTS